MFRKILLYLCLVVADLAAASSLRTGLGFLSGEGRNAPGVFGAYANSGESLDLSWGVESGLYFQSSPSGISLPLQGAVYYRFTQFRRDLVPSVGLSGGVLVTLGPGVRLDLLVLVHPSVDFLISESLSGFVRMSFGVKGAAFQFAPLLGVAWQWGG